jgi:hypothetical protein
MLAFTFKLYAISSKPSKHAAEICPSVDLGLHILLEEAVRP